MLGRYYLTFLGFSMGENFITKAYESGMITILTSARGIIGFNDGWLYDPHPTVSPQPCLNHAGVRRGTDCRAAVFGQPAYGRAAVISDDALLLGAEKEK